MRRRRPRTTDAFGLDVPEEGMYEDAAYRPARKTPPAYMDVPTCMGCGAHACVPADSYPGDVVTDRDLLCAVCGIRFVGTPEQLDQAHRAEWAWSKRDDKRRGPWMHVLRSRSKKNTAQVGLFGEKEDKP